MFKFSDAFCVPGPLINYPICVIFFSFLGCFERSGLVCRVRDLFSQPLRLTAPALQDETGLRRSEPRTAIVHETIHERVRW